MADLSSPSDSGRVDVACLQRLEPLRSLSAGRLEELAALSRVKFVPLGQALSRPPEDASQSVYLLSGELKIGFPDGSYCVYVGGVERTAWPVLSGSAAWYGALAITDVELLCIDSDMLDILMTWDQLSAATHAVPAAYDEPDWRLMAGAFRLQSLTAGVLSRLPPASIDALFRRFERVRMAAGQTVVREGEPGDYYYVIESGRCEVMRSVGGGELPLAELRAGDAFGEEALVADGLRNATVLMKTDGVLLRLGKEDFVELLREPLLRRVTRAEAEARVSQGAVWLDVRYPSEYCSDRLPRAINVPLNEIRHAIDLLDRRRDYIVYCQSGRRSSAAAFLLSQHGFRASWLEGGFNQG